MHGQKYEFDAEENKVILKVATRMTWAGVIAIVYGVINLLSYLTAFLYPDMEVDWSDMVYELAVTSMYVIIGLLTLTVAKYFRLIHGTDGEDIQHLLEAFLSLAKLKMVQVILFSLIILYILIDKVPFVIKMLSTPMLPDPGM
ncbi:hypothetical protein [Thermoflexibacter ruber]|uniref:Uncharacterized protein n=1 Tax=Thermoflexibacter ruber TaxID=1003 RepID=A0A1I2HB97_9BACT|nr:hypothetical protein [Thermoflexibacter ruber]SFF27454.1 hypothetical protein SAMN04488541_102326 [Thermoflexibacter ruber]